MHDSFFEAHGVKWNGCDSMSLACEKAKCLSIVFLLLTLESSSQFMLSALLSVGLCAY